MCELNVVFTASNFHDMRVCSACNGASFHRSGAAAVHVVILGLDQVRIEEKFGPEPVNRDAPDPMLGSAAAHM